MPLVATGCSTTSSSWTRCTPRSAVRSHWPRWSFRVSCARRAFGWPEATPVPVIEPSRCIAFWSRSEGLGEALPLERHGLRPPVVRPPRPEPTCVQTRSLPGRVCRDFPRCSPRVGRSTQRGHSRTGSTPCRRHSSSPSPEPTRPVPWLSRWGSERWTPTPCADPPASRAVVNLARRVCLLLAIPLPSPQKVLEFHRTRRP